MQKSYSGFVFETDNVLMWFPVLCQDPTCGGNVICIDGALFLLRGLDLVLLVLVSFPQQNGTFSCDRWAKG